MKNPFVAIILIAASCLLGVFLLWPQFQELQETRSAIEEKKAEVLNQEHHFSDIEKAEVLLFQEQEPLSKIDSALPRINSFPDLFNLLQARASQAGLVLKDILLGASSEKKRVKEVLVNLTVSGSYPALKEFVIKLENSARLIEVEQITFSSAKGSLFNFHMQIKAYSY